MLQLKPHVVTCTAAVRTNATLCLHSATADLISGTRNKGCVVMRLIAVSTLKQKLRYSGLLHSEQWQLLADVLGQPIGPVFKGQEDRSQHNTLFVPK